MDSLSPKQREYLGFIRSFQYHERCSPSIGDIAKAFGVTKHAVFKMLRTLVRKKAIERNKTGRILFPEAALNKPFLLSK